MSVITVGHQCALGVDVINVSGDHDLPDLAPHLSRREFQRLGRLTFDERINELALLWSMKEATVKMDGAGLLFDVSRLSFSPGTHLLLTNPGELHALNQFSVRAMTLSDRFGISHVAVASGD